MKVSSESYLFDDSVNTLDCKFLESNSVHGSGKLSGPLWCKDEF